jgi:hypothetical protein
MRDLRVLCTENGNRPLGEPGLRSNKTGSTEKHYSIGTDGKISRKYLVAYFEGELGTACILLDKAFLSLWRVCEHGQ